MLEKRNKAILFGIICILISSFGFALMQLFVKLAGDLPSIQKSFFRNFFAMIIALIPLLKSKRNKLNISGSWGILILRSIFGTLGIVFNFVAVSYLDLGDASLLQKLSPFVIIILSLIFLKEKVHTYQWIAIFIAFIGVIFVVSPTGASFNIGYIYAIGGAIMAGSAYTCVRKLGIKGIKGEFIIFFFSAFSCVSLLPFVLFNYKPMSVGQLVCLVFVGLSAAMGQFGITFAYKFAPAKSISVFEYSQIIFAAILGFIVFSEIPTFNSWIGYLIIISVGIFMILKGASSDKKSNNNKS